MSEATKQSSPRRTTGCVTSLALMLRRRLAPPQPRRGDIGAVADRLELEPHRGLDNPFTAGEGAETAIGRGDHALAVTDDRHRLFDPVCDDFRMLDEVAGALDHAGNKDELLRQRDALERGILVRVARIGELD